jgi:aspartyl-tRNA(Asn)/glutamyl-tRNA(Gln) amidotransferase subunit A
MSDDLAFTGVGELSRLLRVRTVSSVELTRLALDRLAAGGPRYNALAELTADLALVQARRADHLLRRGPADSPLLGIPYGAKDLLATKGIPTRWGAPPFRDQIFDYDAAAITRLRAAGAVLVGKLAMVELAGGGGYHYASASMHGPGLNPWNLSHWSGGSSSGSGSAVAAGLVAFALGSETWGSIMTPASFCGISGLRPTAGRVSRAGAMELAWSMDKVGPMARSARDSGWILQAIAGHDPADASTVRREFVFRSRIQRRPFRLGVLPLDYEDAPGGTETQRAFMEALGVLRATGMKVAAAVWPDYPMGDIARAILGGETAAAHEDFIKSDRLDELVDAGQKEGLRGYLNLTAAELGRASVQRARAAQGVVAMFEGFDALVAPTVIGEAVTLDTNLSSRAGGRQRVSRSRGTSVLGAIAGVPALSVPMGFGPTGLPLGLSITGNLFEENTILQIGMRYQRETDWHRRRPPEMGQGFA